MVGDRHVLDQLCTTTTEVFLSLLESFHQFDPKYSQEFYSHWKSAILIIKESKRASTFMRHMNQFKVVIDHLRTAEHRCEQLALLSVLKVYIENVPHDQLKKLKENGDNVDNVDNADIVEKLIQLMQHPTIVNQNAFLHEIDELGDCIVSVEPTQIVCEKLKMHCNTSEHKMWIDFNLKDKSVIFVTFSLSNSENRCLAVGDHIKIRENFGDDYMVEINGAWNILTNNADPFQKKVTIKIFLDNFISESVKNVFHFVHSGFVGSISQALTERAPSPKNAIDDSNIETPSKGSQRKDSTESNPPRNISGSKKSLTQTVQQQLQKNNSSDDLQALLYAGRNIVEKSAIIAAECLTDRNSTEVITKLVNPIALKQLDNDRKEELAPIESNNETMKKSINDECVTVSDMSIDDDRSLRDDMSIPVVDDSEYDDSEGDVEMNESENEDGYSSIGWNEFDETVRFTKEQQLNKTFVITRMEEDKTLEKCGSPIQNVTKKRTVNFMHSSQIDMQVSLKQTHRLDIFSQPTTSRERSLIKAAPMQIFLPKRSENAHPKELQRKSVEKSSEDSSIRNHSQNRNNAINQSHGFGWDARKRSMTPETRHDSQKKVKLLNRSNEMSQAPHTQETTNFSQNPYEMFVPLATSTQQRFSQQQNENGHVFNETTTSTEHFQNTANSQIRNLSQYQTENVVSLPVSRQASQGKSLQISLLEETTKTEPARVTQDFEEEVSPGSSRTTRKTTKQSKTNSYVQPTEPAKVSRDSEERSPVSSQTTKKSTKLPEANSYVPPTEPASATENSEEKSPVPSLTNSKFIKPPKVKPYVPPTEPARVIQNYEDRSPVPSRITRKSTKQPKDEMYVPPSLTENLSQNQIAESIPSPAVATQASQKSSDLKQQTAKALVDPTHKSKKISSQSTVPSRTTSKFTKPPKVKSYVPPTQPARAIQNYEDRSPVPCRITRKSTKQPKNEMYVPPSLTENLSQNQIVESIPSPAVATQASQKSSDSKQRTAKAESLVEPTHKSKKISSQSTVPSLTTSKSTKQPKVKSYVPPTEPARAIQNYEDRSPVTSRTTSKFTEPPKVKSYVPPTEPARATQESEERSPVSSQTTKKSTKLPEANSYVPPTEPASATENSEESTVPSRTTSKFTKPPKVKSYVPPTQPARAIHNYEDRSPVPSRITRKSTKQPMDEMYVPPSLTENLSQNQIVESIPSPAVATQASQKSSNSKQQTAKAESLVEPTHKSKKISSQSTASEAIKKLSQLKSLRQQTVSAVSLPQIKITQKALMATQNSPQNGTETFAPEVVQNQTENDEIVDRAEITSSSPRKTSESPKRYSSPYAIESFVSEEAKHRSLPKNNSLKIESWIGSQLSRKTSKYRHVVPGVTTTTSTKQRFSKSLKRLSSQKSTKPSQGRQEKYVRTSGSTYNETFQTTNDGHSTIVSNMDDDPYDMPVHNETDEGDNIRIDDAGMINDEKGCVFANNDELLRETSFFIEKDGLAYMKTEAFKELNVNKREKIERQFRTIVTMMNRGLNDLHRDNDKSSEVDPYVPVQSELKVHKMCKPKLRTETSVMEQVSVIYSQNNDRGMTTSEKVSFKITRRRVSKIYDVNDDNTSSTSTFTKIRSKRQKSSTKRTKPTYEKKGFKTKKFLRVKEPQFKKDVKSSLPIYASEKMKALHRERALSRSTEAQNDVNMDCADPSVDDAMDVSNKNRTEKLPIDASVKMKDLHRERELSCSTEPQNDVNMDRADPLVDDAMNVSIKSTEKLPIDASAKKKLPIYASEKMKALHRQREILSLRDVERDPTTTEIIADCYDLTINHLNAPTSDGPMDIFNQNRIEELPTKVMKPTYRKQDIASSTAGNRSQLLADVNMADSSPNAPKAEAPITDDIQIDDVPITDAPIDVLIEIVPTTAASTIIKTANRKQTTFPEQVENISSLIQAKRDPPSADIDCAGDVANSLRTERTSEHICDMVTCDANLNVVISSMKDSVEMCERHKQLVENFIESLVIDSKRNIIVNDFTDIVNTAMESIQSLCDNALAQCEAIEKKINE